MHVSIYGSASITTLAFSASNICKLSVYARLSLSNYVINETIESVEDYILELPNYLIY